MWQRVFSGALRDGGGYWPTESRKNLAEVVSSSFVGTAYHDADGESASQP